MVNLYLIELLLALDPARRKAFLLYLDSPYHNKGWMALPLKRLTNYLFKAVAYHPEPAIDKDKMIREVFPNEPASHGKLEKLLSELKKQIQRFIIVDNLDESEDDYQINLSRQLTHLGLTNQAVQVLTKLKQLANHPSGESLMHFFNKMRIEQELHEVQSIHNLQIGAINIPETIQSLDLYYFTYRTELLNRYSLQQKATNLRDIDSTYGKIEYYANQSTLLDISLKIANLLKKEIPTIEDFHHLRNQLVANQVTISVEAYSQAYAYLRNCCTMLFNTGHLEFLPVLHTLNKDSLERGFLFVNQKILPSAYLNLILVAIKCHEYDWAKEFTEQYKDAIVGGDKDSFFYRCNMAHCLFAEKKWDEALDVIPDSTSNSYFHQIVKTLELKIYYELHSDLLEYKADAFRKYIERTAPKNVSSDFREMFLNFLHILTQLAQSPLKNKARSEKIIARIHEKKLLADRNWLLEKARELG